MVIFERGEGFKYVFTPHFYRSGARYDGYNYHRNMFSVSLWATMFFCNKIKVFQQPCPDSRRQCAHSPALQLHRVSTDKDKKMLWRAWRFLCEHTAASCAAEAAVAAATAASYRSEAAGGVERRSSHADPSATLSTAESKGHSRGKQLGKVVSDHVNMLV